MEQKNAKKKSYYASLKGFKRCVPIILGALAVFIAICFISDGAGAFGNGIKPVLLGLFSIGAYAIPPLLFLHAIFYAQDVAKKRVLSRFLFSLVTLILVCSIEYTIVFWNKEMVFTPKEFYNSKTAGGFIGSIIAFGLVKALGPIGLYILAAALVAIYISFFFANRNSVFSRAVFAILGFFAGLLALIEKGIKAFFGFFKKSKEKRRKKENEKKNQELLDDQFFEVDDGMSELRISEPGATEDASAKSSDTDLTDNYKSEISQEPVRSSDETKAKRSFNLDYGLEHGMFDAIFEKDNKNTKADFSDEIIGEEKRSDSYGLDESAENVFTKDFDPFDFAVNQKIASKPSTRSVIEESSAKEENRSISNMTNEEIERERRRAEFEKRKQMVIGKRAEADGMSSESVGGVTSGIKTVEFNVTNEPKIIERVPTEGNVFRGTFDKQEHREHDAEKAAAHVAEIVAMNNPAYARSANQVYTYVKITENEASSNASSSEQADTRNDVANGSNSSVTFEFNSDNASIDSDNKNDKAFEVPSAYNPFKPYTPPTVEDIPVVENVTNSETLTVERSMVSPAPEASHDDTVVNNSNNSLSYDFTAREASLPQNEDASFYSYEDENVPSSVSAVSERDSKYTLLLEDMQVLESTEDVEQHSDEGMTFSFEEDSPKETPLSISTAPVLDDGTVFSFGDEDEESEEEIINEIPEEEAIFSEEIPPEEQNPEIFKQRAMFPFLDESDDADQEGSVNEPIKQESADESEQFFDSPSEAIENAVEEKAEDNAPPFEIDEPAPASSAAVVPIKKAQDEKKEATKPDYSNYVFPSIELLGKEEKEVEADVEGEIQENADKLIETLASFNVTASIKGVDRGPRITRYEVVPARGVKVSSVMNLQDDIALGLAAEGIRMEAPIPGKSAIGVEIPNIHEETVRLRELLETEDFINAKSKTTICIGKDVTGQPVINDIAKMPHLLIAGATGMGKSVCINSLMISILYKARPDEVKFIMIDPKQVEFTMYNGIPHLLVPVVSDAKQAAGALMWAVEEMERRYNLLNTQYVRNVDAYNEKIKDDPSIGEPMSRIVIVIDEFADLMLQVRDPVENLVMRIAQKARAAGIHLIIGTQRPAVNVITGTIKANVPSRISCKVASNTDSRTVLDAGGAEKLLNKGDMLFSFAGAIKPLRVQGAFVKDSEVESIMKYLKQFSNGENYDQNVMEEIERAAQKCSKKGGGSDYEDDDSQGSGEGYLNDRQFLDAVELAVNSGRIATSLIQRKLSVGYSKAAKFIDIMEDMGIVGEGNGPKPREVLISADEWREKLSRTMID